MFLVSIINLGKDEGTMAGLTSRWCVLWVDRMIFEGKEKYAREAKAKWVVRWY
jgi:hypothetical protein